ncbi:peptidase family C78-domain-containing protein [Blyttiomyces helicus]|uniref:Peptidase family C78-domain-containing protein n=1 Tax=Blyttiomyces helicus TaxID=388810 RepID=A0A4P9WFK2_9FUNG|nr:peptidase family C78-domain-containing protein [Blyttiomyces helicus]|eukprot:RKO91539.1 peptidase family C78-domain-containing protein [Blyttiomyces helicus]
MLFTCGPCDTFARVTLHVSRLPPPDPVLERWALDRESEALKEDGALGVNDLCGLKVMETAGFAALGNQATGIIFLQPLAEPVLALDLRSLVRRHDRIARGRTASRQTLNASSELWYSHPVTRNGIGCESSNRISKANASKEASDLTSLNLDALQNHVALDHGEDRTPQDHSDFEADLFDPPDQRPHPSSPGPSANSKLERKAFETLFRLDGRPPSGKRQSSSDGPPQKRAREAARPLDGPLATFDAIPALRLLLLESSRSPATTPGSDATAWSYLCDPAVVHYQGEKADSGWGCGFRNFQLLASVLYASSTYRSRMSALLAEQGGTVAVMPDVTSLQRLIEGAWGRGFDPEGAAQVGTRKWIGTTEVAAVLLSSNIKIYDFERPAHLPKSTPHRSLLEFVERYFDVPAEGPSLDGPSESPGPPRRRIPPAVTITSRPPRTIVGIEKPRSGPANLLIMDPYRRPATGLAVDHATSAAARRMLKQVRLPLSKLSHAQYQILEVVGVGSPTDTERGLGAGVTCKVPWKA